MFELSLTMRAPRLNCVLINFNFSGIIAALNQLRFCVGFSTYCTAQFKHKLLIQTVMVERPSIYHICQLLFSFSLSLSLLLSISSSCSCSYNDPNKHLFCCRLFLLLFLLLHVDSIPGLQRLATPTSRRSSVCYIFCRFAY